MFNLNYDDRLSSWAQHRSRLEQCDDPYTATWEYWKTAPFVPYNPDVDPFYPRNWPNPWEIIVENRYDDFTKALMIGYSLKWTKRFENTPIEIRTVVDSAKNMSYNIVCVDNKWAINYEDSGPIQLENWPDNFLIENLVELTVPR
jgi:hypothetical protein